MNLKCVVLTATASVLLSLSPAPTQAHTPYGPTWGYGYSYPYSYSYSRTYPKKPSFRKSSKARRHPYRKPSSGRIGINPRYYPGEGWVYW